MDLNEQRIWFDSPEFQSEYHCNTPLGAYCSPSGSVFRLWAPTAQAVTLFLYEAGNGGQPLEKLHLQQRPKGLWQFETDRNLDGTYYEYEVTVDQITRRTADPYARACGVNGSRSMVLDLRRTDPENWMGDLPPAPTPEQVIYELHIKDFSWDPAGGFAEADRGRYTALCHTGTTLNRDGIHPTGLDYMKRLGVTHIQLMPVYDFGSVDETCPADQYNWGYDPVNYNVPEGSYSSDPYHGEVRIKELKQAIQSLHRHGFRVIMDVVYNHTYNLDSWLWRTVPWYYYRQNRDGSASNGSGCGNELATERSMCARYILDSVLYWAEEYHIDGFRFDLMGLLDTELMNHIQAALDERYGAGEKLIYGEPWCGGSTSPRPGTVLCTKDHLKELDPRIGAFCDNTRDAVKGSLMSLDAVGFVNGGGIDAARLRPCIAGHTEGADAPFQSPSQTITYLSCHDDWTLWDKLVATMDPKQNYKGNQAKILRANRLAAAINFCCQGRPFFLAGEEFGRTKGGVKNSYCSAPQINQMDWTRAWKNHRLVDYYRGLIALRKQITTLQDKSSDAARRILSVFDIAQNCTGVFLDTRSPNCKWDEILMIFHTGSDPCPFQMPDGRWQLLTDEQSSFRWRENRTVTGKIELPPCSAWILGWKER